MLVGVTDDSRTVACDGGRRGGADIEPVDEREPGRRTLEAGDPANPTGPAPGLFTRAQQPERFTSDGPRRVFFAPDWAALTPGDLGATGGVVLAKPDLVAADGVATSVPGFTSFFGTSAAAPHAADRWPAYPQIIVFCETHSDVALCLSLAHEKALWAVPRSGRHSLANYSTCSGMIIDVSLLDAIAVDPVAKTAKVGAGTNFGLLNEVLDAYDLHVPGALVRLDHFNQVTPDVPRAVAHLESLGFRVTEDIQDADGTQFAAWLRRKPTVHDTAMTGGDGPRMHHIAFATHDASPR